MKLWLLYIYEALKEIDVFWFIINTINKNNLLNDIIILLLSFIYSWKNYLLIKIINDKIDEFFINLFNLLIKIKQ